MPATLGISGREYNAETEFASYTIQKGDGSRVVALQFVRGRGDEQFAIVSLARTVTTAFAGAVAAVAQEFQPSYKVASQAEIVGLIQESHGAFAMNIVDKRHLEKAITLFETASLIRDCGPVQAFGKLTQGFKGLTGIEINPAELIAQVADKVGHKKVDGRKGCLIM